MYRVSPFTLATRKLRAKPQLQHVLRAEKWNWPYPGDYRALQPEMDALPASSHLVLITDRVRNLCSLHFADGEVEVSTLIRVE